MGGWLSIRWEGDVEKTDERLLSVRETKRGEGVFGEGAFESMVSIGRLNFKADSFEGVVEKCNRRVFLGGVGVGREIGVERDGLNGS